jgi:hypothetical protein
MGIFQLCERLSNGTNRSEVTFATETPRVAGRYDRGQDPMSLVPFLVRAMRSRPGPSGSCGASDRPVRSARRFGSQPHSDRSKPVLAGPRIDRLTPTGVGK